MNDNPRPGGCKPCVGLSVHAYRDRPSRGEGGSPAGHVLSPLFLRRGLVQRTPDALEQAAGYVGVNLGRSHAGVAQELLDNPHVRAALQEMGGEAVQERFNVRCGSGFPDDK